MTKSLASVNVSRETRDRLKTLEELVCKWNPRINLVAPSTLNVLWDRHVADSLQLIELVETPTQGWLDLGSGGGFPGVVIAIALAEVTDQPVVTMVESDQRKAAFLRTVLRETGVRAKVISERIEDVEPQGSSLISARALAPLDRLLEYVAPHLAPTGIALLPKGKHWKSEVEQATRHWRFSLECHTSKTNTESVILEIGDLDHV